MEYGEKVHDGITSQGGTAKDVWFPKDRVTLKDAKCSFGNPAPRIAIKWTGVFGFQKTVFLSG